MRTLARLALAALLLALVLPASAETTLGSGVGKGEVVTIKELVAHPDAWVGKTVRVEGTIDEVCPKMGCWMRLVDGPDGVRIKVKDGEIVFPKDGKGKRAAAEGVFSKVELTEEQAVARAQHEAEELGKKFDPATIKGPQTIYQIAGTGAVIR